jgi:hypothetical protein
MLGRRGLTISRENYISMSNSLHAHSSPQKHVANFAQTYVLPMDLEILGHCKRSYLNI